MEKTEVRDHNKANTLASNSSPAVEQIILFIIQDINNKSVYVANSARTDYDFLILVEKGHFLALLLLIYICTSN